MPEGNSTRYIYDGRGNISETRISPKPGSALAQIKTFANFDATCSNAKTCNQPNTTTDERGKVTNYTYDSTHGGVTKIERPAPSGSGNRPTINYSYTGLQAYYKNGSGSIVASGETVYRLTGTTTCPTTSTCAGSADEVKTSVNYGPQVAGTGNNLLPVSTSNGSGNGALTATTAYSYDDIGNLTYVDGPLPGNVDVTRMLYDAARQQIGLIGPDPDGGAYPLKNLATRVTYNAKGQVTKTERGNTNGQNDADWAAFAPAERVETGYDAANRKTIDTLLAGSTAYAVTQYSYLANDLTDCVAQRMNPAVFGSISGTGACSAGAAGAQGPDRIVKTLYDNADRPTVTREAAGTALQRDTATMSYNGNSQVETLTDAKGNKTTYEYDDFYRPAKTRYPSATTPGSSSTTDYEESVYNCNASHCDNLVTALRLRDGQSIGLGYDDLSRLTSKNLPGAEPDVSYTYDLIGRLTSASQTGNTLSFTYDALSRNLTQTGPLGTVASTWDVAGRRIRLDLPGGFWTSYDYTTTGAMWAIREWGATSGVGVNYIGYDDLGRRANIQRGNGTVTYYDYDPVSRLSQLNQAFPSSSSNQVMGYSYNPASQIASRSAMNDGYAMRQQYNASRAYTVNGLNQYLTAGSISPAYDGRGNLTAQGSTSYAYSSENLMTQVSQSSGTTGLSYDPAMRLYQIGGTRFLYDGTDLVAEYDGSGNVLRRYVHGPGTDEVITWYEGGDASQRRWLHSDERGSVIGVSDVNGALLQANAYDEWGNPQSGNLGRFGYTGQTWLPEVGLWYYKARMYSPRLGRFMQTDPIGYQDGMNLYAYVRNDPLNLVDPNGADSCPNNPYDSSCGGSDIFVTAPKYYDVPSAGFAPGGGLVTDLSSAAGGDGPTQQSVDEKFGLTADNMKGERNRTAKPSGTNNPFKKIKSHPSRPGWVQYKDQNGKTKERPGTPDELAHLAQKGNPITGGARIIIPFVVGVGMCTIAPSTCPIVDVNGDGTLDFDDWESY